MHYDLVLGKHSFQMAPSEDFVGTLYERSLLRNMNYFNESDVSEIECGRFYQSNALSQVVHARVHVKVCVHDESSDTVGDAIAFIFMGVSYYLMPS